MDKKDEKIIECLRENANLSSHKISKKTLIPVTTVHNRLKKLITSGIIKRYTIEIDYEKIGKPISACILININMKDLRRNNMSFSDLSKKIKKMPEVETSISITGQYDVLVLVRTESVVKLNDFLLSLRKIEGINRTQTGIFLNEY